MAYGDYSSMGGMATGRATYQRQPMPTQPPPVPQGQQALQTALQPQQQPTSPFGAQQPQGTRAQAVQQVQQAYSTPTRMPGDMGALNGLISQSQQGPSADDPIMSGAFAAGRVADQRNMERQRAALAEQLGGMGLGDSGAMQTKLGGIQQRIGESQALRESGMLYDESNARRNALLQALGLDQSRYGQDQDLGYRLAALEAQLNAQAVQPFF